jgi:hypothetical protein
MPEITVRAYTIMPEREPSTVMPEITMNKSSLGQTVQISTVTQTTEHPWDPCQPLSASGAPCQTPHNLER